MYSPSPIWNDFQFAAKEWYKYYVWFLHSPLIQLLLFGWNNACHDWPKHPGIKGNWISQWCGVCWLRCWTGWRCGALKGEFRKKEKNGKKKSSEWCVYLIKATTIAKTEMLLSSFLFSHHSFQSNVYTLKTIITGLYTWSWIKLGSATTKNCSTQWQSWFCCCKMSSCSGSCKSESLLAKCAFAVQTQIYSCKHGP